MIVDGPVHTAAMPSRPQLVTEPPRRVVVVAPDPAQELDVTGPTAVFGQANRLSGRASPPYQIHVASVRDDGMICTESGLRLLAATGLLDAHRATTHWRHADRLATRHPRVRVDPDPIWIREGGLYTSAGVTAGMDLALALVEEDLGYAASLEVARELVLFLRRPGTQAQFSTVLQAQAAQSPELRELQAWIADHLAHDLSVAVLAERVAMSPRNFARVFAREVGETPARYVERLRVEAVRRMLEAGDQRLEAVARTTGFGNADVMRQAFLRHVQTTPERYRAAFRAGVAA